MNILLWIIFGGLAGWLASIIVGAEEGTGLISNVVVGAMGALLGGWIAEKVQIKEERPDKVRPTTLRSFSWAVVGAIIILLLLNLIF